MPKSDSRLGKGLGALLGDVLEVPMGTEVPVEDVEVALIEPNRFQPRSDFDPSAISQLRASIKENGLMVEVQNTKCL